jgi:hypothetical protein
MKLGLALSKLLKKKLSALLPEDGHVLFPKRCVLWALECRKMGGVDISSNSES